MEALATFLGGLQWGEPQVCGPLTLLPLFHPGRAPRRYLSLAEALEQHAVSLTELSEAAVGQVHVANRGAWPVLLVDGEEVVGAKQDRVFSTSLLLPAEAAVTVPVNCVEQGRWQHVSDEFTGSSRLLSPRVRRRQREAVGASLAAGGSRHAGQSEVWDGVADQLRQAGAVSATGAMRHAYESLDSELAAQLAVLPCHAHQKGFLAFVDGQPVGLEAVSSSRVYARLHDKLLRGYLLDARQPPAAAAQPGLSAAAFVSRLAAVPAAVYPSLGHGEEVRLAGEGLTGLALVDRGAVVQLSVLAQPAETPLTVPWSRSYWVEPGRLLAGCYPGEKDAAARHRKLEAILDHGVTCIINLMLATERGHQQEPFTPYAAEFCELARSRGLVARCLRLPIPDGTAPRRSHMSEILDAVDLALDAGQVVLVHCWGGRGRTGAVVGCWLARHGRASGPDALALIQQLRQGVSDAHQDSPEQPAQERLVAGWRPGF